MRLGRPSVLSAAALLSAVLLGVVLVGWARSYPHAGCVGWGQVREATPAGVVVDSDTLQCARGQVWCGRCRMSVVTVLGFRNPPADAAAGLEREARYLNVFAVPDFAAALDGFGPVAGTTREFVGHGFLWYEIDGVVLPCWFLALLAALLPALWAWRRVRAR